MTIPKSTVTAILVFFIALCAARAEDASSAKANKAEQVIERHIEALGGVAKIRALETLCIKGRLEQEGLELPFTLWRKRPARNRLEIGFRGQFFTMGHGGGKTWWINPLAGVFKPEAVPEEYAAIVRRWADFEGPLVDYREKGHRVEYAGEQNTDAGMLHRIKVTLSGGEVWHVYIDARTHLEIKRTFPQTYAGRTAETTTWFRDYATVEGVKVYRVIEGKGPDGTPYTMTLESFEANTPVDDVRFEMR